MKMVNKILWITDDHIKHKNTYVSLWREIGKLVLIDSFSFIKNIDFVIVDYGLLGNMSNVNTLKKYYLKGIPIIWSGGFGGSDKYIEDCKKVFPKEKWLHKIESVALSDLRWCIGNYFDVEIR